MVMHSTARTRVGDLSGRRITCIRDQDQANGTDRGNVLLVVQRSGRSVVSQDGREAEVAAGQMVLVDLSRPYLFDIVSDFDQTVVEVPTSSLGPSAHSRGFAAVALDSDGPLAPMAAFIEETRKSTTKWGSRGIEPVESTLREIFSTLGEFAARTSTDRVDPREVLLARVVNYARVHCHDPDLDVQRLADAFHVSRRGLFRLFEGLDAGPAEIISASRLERAEALMEQAPSRSLESIRLACGFGSRASFHRLFRQRHGCAPAEFRRGVAGPTSLARRRR